MTIEAIANLVLRERENLKRKYDRNVAQLDAAELTIARAEQLAVEWRNSGEDRKATVYLSPSFESFVWIAVTLELPRGSMFSEAAEMFEKAEGELARSFPPGWTVEVGDMADTTASAERAKRGVTIKASKPGGIGSDAYVHLDVCVPVGDGDACKVVKVKEERVGGYSSPGYTRAIYRSTCPGDPLEASR